MKLSLASIGLAVIADAANIPRCSANGCYPAISEDLAVGESFCSSWLNLAPRTTVLTEYETVTTTEVKATATTAAVVTVYRRSMGLGPAESILSKCSQDSTIVSDACSSFLTTATTSFVTLHETSTSTVTLYDTAKATTVDEPTTTTTDTTTAVDTTAIAGTITSTTADTTTTIAAEATTTTSTTPIPTQPIVNGGFETFSSTTPQNILPWTDSRATTGGTIQYISGVRAVSNNPTYTAGADSHVVRVYPPKSLGSYFAIYNTFPVLKSTTYELSFMFRCLNFDGTSGIDAYFGGVKIASVICLDAGAVFTRTTGHTFTTDGSGIGELEIRFVNPSGLPYLYFYADEFFATEVV